MAAATATPPPASTLPASPPASERTRDACSEQPSSARSRSFGSPNPSQSTQSTNPPSPSPRNKAFDRDSARTVPSPASRCPAAPPTATNQTLPASVIPVLPHETTPERCYG